MMNEESIVKVLKENKDVSAYKVVSTKTSSYELFYVQKKLETNRATDTADYSVTVYVDQDHRRGSSTFSVYPYMDGEELSAKIRENVEAAKYALNPYYPLPEKEEAKIPEPDSNFSKKPLKDLIKDVKEAVFEADYVPSSSLSATEIFLYDDHTRILNSNGVDLMYHTYKGNIETIPNYVKKKNDEYELYKMIRFSSFDKEDIVSQVKEVLSLVKARAEASVPPSFKEGTKVILEDGESAQVFRFFADDLSYARKYNRMNRNELGDCVQGENVTGTKLNLKLVPSYPNAMDSRAVDGDGVVLDEVNLIEDGIAKNRFGSYRYGYYLGEKRPTGEVPVMVVKEGTVPFAEMKKEPYLRCVRFSGMQLNPNSGFIGGEVRLGFYFDGEKEIPVTGISISGDIHALKGAIVYSKETVTLPSYHGPKYLEIRGMKIA